MISQNSPKVQPNVFATPPSKKMVEPRSITRKPSFVSFTKKKPTEIGQIRSSDRIRFISPTKANLAIPQDIIDPQNSIEFSYTQYSSNQQINYPFIKRCTSPKHFDNVNISRTISRKSSFCNDSIKQDNSFLSTFLEPSIQDFSNCQFAASRINNTEQLQQQISSLKKTNFQLNLLLDEKNELIEKQKLENDMRLNELTQQLTEIKNGIQKSESKIFQTQNKIQSYELKVKELEDKLSQTTEKLQRAEKEVKMFKAKYRVNFNNPKLSQELKSKKYHQNCCKGQQNHEIHTKSNKQIQYTSKPSLKQSRKSNNASNISIGPSLKKIKSETILPGTDHKSNENSPSTSHLMKIHCIEEEFNEYISMKVQIQNLSKEIRYKDIEILTLKKAKCDFEKEKENFDKVKKFNKKLLARVQFLTKQFEQANKSNRKRLSLPIQTTPKKKFQVQYQDFDEESDEQEVAEFVEFQLSPEKNYSDTHPKTETELVFDIEGLK